MSEAPGFWWDRKDARAWLMSPIGAIYGALAAWRMTRAPSFAAPLPVLCVGNFIAGGAGKTPTALMLADLARKKGRKPGFLSRGYGGRITGTALVDRKTHTAFDVGDEPMLLAANAPTVVSANRVKGAQLLVEQDVDFIIMDDGMQNPALAKDYTLGVVDSRRGMGNGFAIPAGPLRARLATQLSSVNSILVIGSDTGSNPLVRQAARRAKPVHQAHIVPVNAKGWARKKLLAFSGIADPEKFYQTVKNLEGNLVETRSFGDHHPFTGEEMEELLTTAASKKLTLATTEKDMARLAGIAAGKNGKSAGKEESPAERLLKQAKPLKIKVEYENPQLAEKVIADTLENFTRRRG